MICHFSEMSAWFICYDFANSIHNETGANILHGNLFLAYSFTFYTGRRKTFFERNASYQIYEEKSLSSSLWPSTKSLVAFGSYCPHFLLHLGVWTGITLLDLKALKWYFLRINLQRPWKQPSWLNLHSKVLSTC